jgi:hypothetical protein
MIYKNSASIYIKKFEEKNQKDMRNIKLLFWSINSFFCNFITGFNLDQNLF